MNCFTRALFLMSWLLVFDGACVLYGSRHISLRYGNYVVSGQLITPFLG
ncbi:hypothetical protein [Trueperella sp. LYQ141]